MRLAWATDLHLGHAEGPAVRGFFEQVEDSRADALLVGGDISSCRSLKKHLMMLDAVDMPVYFVLGNHDYYDCSIEVGNKIAEETARASENLCWLDSHLPLELSPTAGLIGVGGWADGRAGNWFLGGGGFINDYTVINDLRFMPDKLLHEKLKSFGRRHAKRLKKKLKQLPDAWTNIIVLTHVPPWREACWHEGKLSDDKWVPHFSCTAVGLVLKAYMEDRPEKQMRVLCGHTHGSGETDILANLRASTGGAKYGRPAINEIFEI